MVENIKRLVNKKSFHLCMVIVIIAIILFSLGIIALKYSVEGETNMPFNLEKIAIISSSEGRDKTNEQYKWAFDVNQNNDVFLYIKKNDKYGKQEIIDSIVIDNINVEKENEKGVIKFYKPEQDEGKTMFNNLEENAINNIEFTGDMKSNLKQLKISNQGGIVAFRYANDELAEYLSNDEEINHNELLKKVNLSEGDLKSKLSFDVTIKLKSGKDYKANISLDVPVEGILEEGTTSREITDMKDIVFKRIKN